MKWSCSIDVRPISKARPRFSRYGTYTPRKTLDYENLIATRAKQAKAVCRENPCSVTLTFTFLKPKKPKGFYCTINKDLDNLSKAVLDSLNGIAFIDDKQVVELNSAKNYGDSDRVVIEIEYLT